LSRFPARDAAAESEGIVRKIFTFALLFLGLISTPAAWAQGVYRIQLDKPIHPVTQEFVVRALAQANGAKADLVLLVIDTPGGYVTSVEAIQKAILQSKAPVVAYVAPAGGRAASGGAMVAMACDLIAMAPGTSIGSAHPVSGLPIPIPKPEKPEEKGKGGDEKEGQPAVPDADVSMEKLVNDLSAHMRSIAENRHRDPATAEAMVRESLSFTEKESLEKGVIELVANGEGDIFRYLLDHPLRRFDGGEVRISVGEAPAVKDIPMTLRESALAMLADPNLAFVLFLLGVLGLFVEFKAPGLIFPGVLGGIFLLLYLLSIPLLPVDLVGLLLVLLGVVFFILEVKVVSFGILTVGGVVSLVAGGLMMYRHGPVPELRSSWSTVVPVALAFAGILAFLLTIAAKAFKNPVTTGAEGMVGVTATVREAVGPGRKGNVFLLGEIWAAESEEECPEGAEVVVTAVRGMVLHVRTRKG
jgi:membrane-bound serine protease (ClpP class)